MSASLVGSEMCIRDRLRRPREVPAGGGTASQSGRDLLAWPCVRRCEGAVSYTHLTLPTICSV
eukprot:5345364-Alexandrium_andersonii.AAC.1